MLLTLRSFNEGWAILLLLVTTICKAKGSERSASWMSWVNLVTYVRFRSMVERSYMNHLLRILPESVELKSFKVDL
jgi:hypothetical protein